MIKVINGGIEVLVEDWPGRLGYMGLGMAAAGAMDSLALQLGNLILGNKKGDAALEIAGGYCQFEIVEDGVIAITGSDMSPTINESAVPMWEAIAVKAGDILKFSHFGEAGFRAYVCIAGEIDVPEYLGSKSTCLFGSYGGFEGRKLAKDDVIKVNRKDASGIAGRKLNPKYIPEYVNEWELRTIPGPNSVPDYVTESGMDYLFSTPMKISHNANRAAYRLQEVPDYFWAREDGGKGGSHPSNIVDHGYNMRGAVNVTGNTPSLLIADGPTLGGFVCVANVINADLWKIGQGIPARDKVKLKLVTVEDAIKARKEREAMFEAADLVID
ncbi:biotin-dependent carboxyltransferase family protein [Clostridium ljungdahlii]|uniref:KipI antagonist n=1 Tax=Clostridium ljungdahlii TaxID=1538 RepID=A0A168LAV8_9CLOT|nr:biotin-dependent carboxyltransferase family protein [Clostridium ljungdahlii]OAA82907.1 KipI antagonist [Clostridium ljungdahlii]